MIDKQRLGRNFGRQAARYDHYARVQKVMAAELVRRLAGLAADFRRILEVGCGTGHLTGLLCGAFPGAQITAVDLSAASLAEARRRLAGAAVEFRQADGEDRMAGEFDLVTSNSVFQWFTRVPETFRGYREQLRPGGWLAFATLGPETFRELTLSLAQAQSQCPGAAAPVVPASRFRGAAEWGRIMREAGFAGAAVESDLTVEGYPGLWDFLRAVRGMGATGTNPAYVSRRLLQAMADCYDATFRVNGVIPVTYEVIFGQGQRRQ